MQTNQPSNWSRGQLEYINSCPSCGSNKQPMNVFERRDNDAFMLDQWHMTQCNDCYSIWLDSRPDVTSLPRAYDNYYTHNAESEDIPENGSGRLIWKLIHGYLNHRFNMQRKPALPIGYLIFSLIEPWRLKLDYYGRHLTHKNVGKPGKLLDIGCGNGAFLKRATEMGWQVKGCEVDPKAASTCRSLGLDVIDGDAFHSSLAEQSFDVITMSHVIEHVVDQQKLLQRINNLLRPGGYLWITLPNPQSIGLQISNTAWHALHPPFHLNIPSRPILINWLKKIGFSNIQSLRRGAHVRQIWKISQTIALRESIGAPSTMRFLIWRLIADLLATFSSRWAEETVLLARKPE